MRKLRYIGSALLLLLCTALIILLPTVWNQLQMEAKLNTQTPWHYDKEQREEMELTARELAALYVQGKTRQSLWLDTVYVEDEAQVKAEVKALLAQCLDAPSAGLRTFLMEQVEEGKLNFCEKTEALTMVEDEMAPLCFVNVSFAGGLELFYEEKTELLLQVSVYQEAEYTDMADSLWKELDAYYAATLGLPAGSYMVLSDVEPGQLHAAIYDGWAGEIEHSLFPIDSY